MTLMETLTEAKANLAEVKAAVESGEKGAEELASAIEGVKSAQASVEAANEAAELLEKLGKAKSEPAEKEEKKMAKNLGEFAAEHIKAQGIDAHEKFTTVTPMFKAAAPMTIPSSIAGAVTEFDTNLVLQPRRQLMVADLFGSETISGNALTYYVESSTVEGGVSTVAEGAKKPLTSFGDPTAKTVSLVKVAAHYKESDELINDAPWLASSINNRGIYLHQLYVENFLVSALAGTSGIGTSSEATADGIFKAMTTVHENSGFAADAIIINPADYQKLRLAKDGNGQYYGGGYFYGEYGQNGIAEQPQVWGLRTVVSSAVSAGTALVGAFKLGASVIHGNGGGMSVNIANQNEDDFIKNMITIVIEERLNLAVRYPAAFVKITGTFPDPTTTTTTA